MGMHFIKKILTPDELKEMLPVPQKYKEISK